QLVSFTNNGPEIPDAIRDKIFNAFFTTKGAGEGSGLGLDIVRKIIEKHDGKIWFESNAEETTFFVYLPGKVES
ncbi:MAG: HAMP domain-containing histidine kinase, partial [Bacteroidetes bacterium]|nr:HAMP domain-containing histidine kinase [Bacteroidota bacterium]